MPALIKFSDWSGGINQAKNPTDLEPVDALELVNQGDSNGGTLRPRLGCERYSAICGGRVLGLARVSLYGREMTVVADSSGTISLLSSSGDSLTVLKDGLSTLDDQYWSFATGSDLPLLMTNGIDMPLLFDGAEVRECGEYSRPLIYGNIITGQPAGQAQFRIAVAWYDEPNDYEGGISNSSELIRANRSSPRFRIALANIKKGMPGRFTHLRFYRTMSDGRAFYYCGQVATAETHIELIATDDELGHLPPYQAEPMPSLRQVISGRGRFWTIGTRPYEEGLVQSAEEGSTQICGYKAGDNSTAWTKAMVGKFITIGDDKAHSYIVFGIDETNQILRIRPPYRGSTGADLTYRIYGDPHTTFFCHKTPLGKVMPENWGGGNRLSSKMGGNSEATALCQVGGRIAVLTEDNILFANEKETGGYSLEQAPSARTGTCAYRTLKSDGEGSMYFLSRHRFGIWRYSPYVQGDENRFVNIGDLIRDKLDAVDRTKLEHAHAVFSDGVYRIWLTSTDAAEGEIGDLCFAWDGRRWTEEEGISALCSAAIIEDGTPYVLLGDEYGYIYKMGVGTNDGANLLDSAERSGYAEQGTGQLIVDSSQTWDVDELKALPINIVAGTGAGQRRRIVSNTATGEITISSPLDTDLDDTSKYAIGAIRFLRRFPWISPKDVVRYWVGKVHQSPQEDGELAIRFYKDYNLEQADSEATAVLTAGIVSFSSKSRADALTFDISQDDVDKDFEIYAVVIEAAAINNRATPAQE